MHKPDLPAALLEDAWDWIFRLRQEDVDQDTLANWLAWYERDECNKTAFDYMQALFQQTDRVAEGHDALPAELWLGPLAPAPAAIRTPAGPAVSRPWFRRRSGAWAVAAVLALCAVSYFMRPEAQWAERIGTVALPADAVMGNPVRANTLADGSRVELAAKTVMSVEMTDKQRTIVMQQGAAYFTVAHNAARPFIVKAGRFNVRAVGTAFNVRNTGGRVVVTVVEGTIDVYPNDSTVSVRAKAGTEVAWAEKTAGPVVTAVDPAHALAWKQGFLDYINEPLDSVVADINRYSARRVVIRDPSVGEILISGTVRTDSAEKWLRSLPGMFPIDIRSDDAGNIVLESRAASPS